MLKTTKRPLTLEERQQLLHLRPSFLWRGRRKAAQQELAEGVAEVLYLEIRRAWDLNGCQPPYCPHCYLFQVGEREYVYAESWTAFNSSDRQFPKHRIEIVRSPLGKHILSAKTEGETVQLEDNPFEAATEYFSFSGDAECEILRPEEMSEEVQSMLAAT